MAPSSVTTWIKRVAGREPWVRLIAFGKHPAWPDHIAPRTESRDADAIALGWNSSRYGPIASLIYDAIKHHLDAGSWTTRAEADREERSMGFRVRVPAALAGDEERLPGYATTLMARDSKHLILARLWSSTDTSGRSKHPMVVAFDCVDLPDAWAIATLVPQLADLESRIRAAGSPDDVLAVLDRQRALLPAACESSPADLQAASFAPSNAVALRWLTGDAHTPAIVDRARLERACGAAKRILLESEAGRGRQSVASCRLPAAWPGAETLLLWHGVLVPELPKNQQVLLLHRHDAHILDAAVGAVGHAEFAPIRWSAGKLPVQESPSDAESGRALVDEWLARLPAVQVPPYLFQGGTAPDVSRDPAFVASSSTEPPTVAAAPTPVQVDAAPPVQAPLTPPIALAPTPPATPPNDPPADKGGSDQHAGGPPAPRDEDAATGNVPPTSERSEQRVPRKETVAVPDGETPRAPESVPTRPSVETPDPPTKATPDATPVGLATPSHPAAEPSVAAIPLVPGDNPSGAPEAGGVEPTTTVQPARDPLGIEPVATRNGAPSEPRSEPTGPAMRVNAWIVGGAAITLIVAGTLVLWALSAGGRGTQSRPVPSTGASTPDQASAPDASPKGTTTPPVVTAGTSAQPDKPAPKAAPTPAAPATPSAEFFQSVIADLSPRSASVASLTGLLDVLKTATDQARALSEFARAHPKLPQDETTLLNEALGRSADVASRARAAASEPDFPAQVEDLEHRARASLESLEKVVQNTILPVATAELRQREMSTSVAHTWSTAVAAAMERVRQKPVSWHDEVTAAESFGDRLTRAAKEMEQSLAASSPPEVDKEEMRQAILIAFRPALEGPGAATPETLNQARVSSAAITTCAQAISEASADTVRNEHDLDALRARVEGCAENLPLSRAAARARLDRAAMVARADCQAIDRLIEYTGWFDSASLRREAVRKTLDCAEFPRSAAELDQLMHSAGTAIQSAPDLRGALAKAWERGAARAAQSGEHLSEYLDLAAARELGPLPSWAQYDREALGARSATPATDEDAATLVAQIAGRVRAQTGIAARPDVSNWLGQLDDAAKPRGRALEQLGPGSLQGWTAQASDDKSFVTYVSSGPHPSILVFRRVTTPAGTAYLLTEEVSVSLFASVYERPQARAEIDRAGGPVNIGRSGPAGLRTWRFLSNGSMRPSTNGAVSGWLPEARFDENSDVPRVPPPNERSPMQAISAAAAAKWAMALNCRLPSLAEWKAAVDEARTRDQPPNTRDHSFAILWNALSASARKQVGAELLVPLDPSAKLADPGFDDRSAMFEPTDSSATGFKHLIGNVAEFVLSDPAGPASKANVLVVGGSAMTPPSDNPYPSVSLKPDAPEWYCDVGFRVALNLSSGIEPKGALRDRVLQELSKAPILSK